MKQECVVKLKLPMPLVDMRPMVRVLERMYGKLFVPMGENIPEGVEFGWFCMVRKIYEPGDTPPPPPPPKKRTPKTRK